MQWSDLEIGSGPLPCVWDWSTDWWRHRLHSGKIARKFISQRSPIYFIRIFGQPLHRILVFHFKWNFSEEFNEPTDESAGTAYALSFFLFGGGDVLKKIYFWGLFGLFYAIFLRSAKRVGPLLLRSITGRWVAVVVVIMAPEAATEAAAEGKKFSLECINTKPFFRRGFQHFLEKKKVLFTTFFCPQRKVLGLKILNWILLFFIILFHWTFFWSTGCRFLRIPAAV